MKLKKIIINCKQTEKRIAVLENEELIQWYSSEGRSSVVGNIYIGRIEDILPKMNAIFVNIGLEKNGFLRFEDTLEWKHQAKDSIDQLRSHFQKGQYILVQVMKDPFDEKGAKLTTSIELTGDYIVYLPNGSMVAVSKKIQSEQKRNKLYQLGRNRLSKEEGIIFRSASNDGKESEIKEELECLKEEFSSFSTIKQAKVQLVWETNSIWKKVSKEHPFHTIDEIITDSIEQLDQRFKNSVSCKSYTGKENIFDAMKVQEQINRSQHKHVWLKNGAFLVIESTEAMTVIDVNTGKFIGKHNQQISAFETNMLAAAEIARQLMVRDIGGMIVIDFINMSSKKDQDAVRNELINSLINDRVLTKVCNFTQLGLLEMTRKRTSQSILQSTHQPCDICNGLGMVKAPDQIAFELERKLWEMSTSDYEAVLVECSNDVAKLLIGEKNEHINRLEKALFTKILVKITPGSKPYFNILRFGNENELKALI
jgi:ribonuclease G